MLSRMALDTAFDGLITAPGVGGKRGEHADYENDAAVNAIDGASGKEI